MSMGWDFLVARDNLERSFVQASPDPAELSLSPGDAVLTVERFALTANNITYGVMGEALGYWKCFPSADWRGRIPVWGYARVTRSAAPDAPEGLRLFGLLPMSTHFVARPQRTGGGYVDAATHRAGLSPFYNRYAPAERVDEAFDNHRALLRPLFTTAFLLDDLLYDAEHSGVRTVILSSASSKTAMALAWLLARHGRTVVGLTSRKHLPLLGSLGLYHRLVSYDTLAGLSVDTPAVYVDFAGDASVTRGIHRQLGPGLHQSLTVGGTHQRTPPPRVQVPPLPGPAPTFFFAPDRLRKRAAEWGMDTLEARLTEALRDFVSANAWLKIAHHQGPEALTAVYREVLSGQASPDTGHLVWPRAPGT